jgi:S-formylglutathione hydrolase FrmB
MRIGGLAVLAMACALTAAPAVRAADDPQLQLTGRAQLDSRLQELTFKTPLVTAAQSKVRVLLPAGYDASGRTRYPVLWLLNGTLDDQRAWTEKGAAEQLTAGLPLIVVMPSGGAGGFYSDWYNNGAFGVPRWETYHVDHLLGWIDAHFPTTGTRAGRAIAGLSMGGFGAFSYAARHPDLFADAASFSGAINTNEPPLAGEPDEALLDGGSPIATWGLRLTDEVRARARNPWDLAGNLRGMALTVRTGNGLPGGPDGSGGDPIELLVHLESTDTHNRLASLGIPHIWDDYGAGSHNWFYWQRDLKQTLPTIMATFAHPPAAPSPFTYTAVDPDYRVYGWHVVMRRPHLEFSTLHDARPGGFALSGSGSATVTTQARYRAGARYEVTVDAPGGDPVATRRKAGKDRRLQIEVPLGPANAAQQFTIPARTAGTKVFTTQVRIVRIAHSKKKKGGR